MLRILVLAATISAAVLAETGTSYTYNFKIAKLCADLVSGVRSGVDFKLGELSKQLQEECRFTKAARELEFGIIKASFSDEECPIEEEAEKLQKYREVYENSIEECFSQAECETGLDDVINKVLSAIQEVDKQAASDVSACSDDACKLKVNHNLHESLDKIYQENMPTLRVAEDQALANTKCSSAFVQCMMTKNGENLKEIYTGIAELQECSGNVIPPFVHGLTHMSSGQPKPAHRPPPPHHGAQPHPHQGHGGRKPSGHHARSFQNAAEEVVPQTYQVNREEFVIEPDFEEGSGDA